MRLQVGDDFLGRRFLDGGAKSLDHLVHLGFPRRRGQRGLLGDVGHAVAHAAVAQRGISPGTCGQLGGVSGPLAHPIHRTVARLHARGLQFRAQRACGIVAGTQQPGAWGFGQCRGQGQRQQRQPSGGSEGEQVEGFLHDLLSRSGAEHQHLLALDLVPQIAAGVPHPAIGLHMSAGVGGAHRQRLQAG